MEKGGINVLEDEIKRLNSDNENQLAQCKAVQTQLDNLKDHYRATCEKKTEVEHALVILKRELSKPMGEQQPALIKDNRHA